MVWLVAYLIFHVLCAIGAYGVFYHVMYSLLPKGRFIIICCSLLGGPIALVIWSFLSWRDGHGIGFKFNVIELPHFEAFLFLFSYLLHARNGREGVHKNFHCGDAVISSTAQRTLPYNFSLQK